MISIIVKWILNSFIFKIVVAVFLDILILVIANEILLKWIFKVIRNTVVRGSVCIGLCTILSWYYYQNMGYKIGIVGIIIILIIYYCIREKKIKSNADNVHFSVSKEFEEQSLNTWGMMLILAILGPIFLCLDTIVCEYYGVNADGWFKFYWTYQEGIFKNEIARYSIALLPLILLLAIFGSLLELKEKDWLVDLEKRRREELQKKKNEQERILRMNPDADMEMFDIGESKVENGEKEPDEQDEDFTDTKNIEDSILNDISKFV